MKIFPVEVKSSKNYTTTSLDTFAKRFKGRVGASIIIHPKNFSADEKLIRIPPYMIPFLFRVENST